MRVRLKGISSSRKRLADGTVKVYWCAWRGGPALPGKPGDPAFLAAYQTAIATKVSARAGTLQAILSAYQQAAAFTELKESTRAGYAWHIARIEREFHDFPLSALADQRTRDVFLKWRDQLGCSSPRQADLTNHHGQPWLTNTFGRGWREACAKAGVKGLTFHDLRGTAVTRLSLAGCTVPEITAITGHSIADADRILDAHYLHRDPKLAEAAIAKLEANVQGTNLQTKLQTGPN